MMSTQDKNVSMYLGFVDMFCGHVQCLYMNLLIGIAEMADKLIQANVKEIGYVW